MNNNLYNIKVEREALRCNEQGKLSKLDHPEIFGDKNKNKFIVFFYHVLLKPPFYCYIFLNFYNLQDFGLIQH